MAEIEKTPAGIFIPYEKLLEQIDGKLDRIEGKLDQKVDVHSFEGFKLAYEGRHQELGMRVATLEGWRNRILGGLALAVVLIPVLTASIVFAMTH